MLLVGFLQHSQQAWHTHRAATHHRIVESHGLVFHHEEALIGLRRCGFTPVIDLHMLAVVV